jgi:hypothetical protein
MNDEFGDNEKYRSMIIDHDGGGGVNFMFLGARVYVWYLS